MKKEEFQIEKLIEILTESELTELKYEENDKLKVKIKKSAVARPKQMPVKTKEIKNEVKPVDNTKGVISEAIGRFFYKDNDGDSIIKVGDKIKEGQELGYLFVMGIKTPIKSTLSGEITEIKVENGGIVDYGKEIVRVKVSDK